MTLWGILIVILIIALVLFLLRGRF